MKKLIIVLFSMFSIMSILAFTSPLGDHCIKCKKQTVESTKVSVDCCKCNGTGSLGRDVEGNKIKCDNCNGSGKRLGSGRVCSNCNYIDYAPRCSY